MLSLKSGSHFDRPKKKLYNDLKKINIDKQQQKNTTTTSKQKTTAKTMEKQIV